MANTTRVRGPRALRSLHQCPPPPPGGAPLEWSALPRDFLAAPLTEAEAAEASGAQLVDWLEQIIVAWRAPSRFVAPPSLRQSREVARSELRSRAARELVGGNV